MLTLDAGEPLAGAITDAIQTGDIDELKKLLAGSPELAGVTIVRRDGCGEQSRSLLHIATDYPGHFPNAEETVRVLIAVGADVNARFTGAHGETPLHWAASSDDVGDRGAAGHPVAGGRNHRVASTPASDQLAGPARKPAWPSIVIAHRRRGRRASASA